MLRGVNYTLTANNGAHSLHGGGKGWDRRVWNSEVVEKGVVFSRLSSDGEEVMLVTKMTDGKISNAGLSRVCGGKCDLHLGGFHLAH